MNPILATLKQNIGKSLGNGPSPVAGWLNGTLIAAEEGSLRAEYVVRKEMCNPMMILHGGTISMMMDDLMGATVFSLGELDFYTSINLAIDFLQSARVGDTVRVSTQIVRKGKTVINIEAKVHDANDKLLAKAMSNMIKTNFKIS